MGLDTHSVNLDEHKFEEIVLLRDTSGRTLSAATPYQGGPRLAVDTDLIDFGPVRFDKVVQARFLLRNVGDQPLQISGNPPVEVVEGC